MQRFKTVNFDSVHTLYQYLYQISDYRWRLHRSIQLPVKFRIMSLLNTLAAGGIATIYAYKPLCESLPLTLFWGSKQDAQYESISGYVSHVEVLHGIICWIFHKLRGRHFVAGLKCDKVQLWVQFFNSKYYITVTLHIHK